MFNSLLPVNGSILGGCGILKNLVWPGLKVGLVQAFIEANFKTKPNFEAKPYRPIKQDQVL